jgi:hypothetical protein
MGAWLRSLGRLWAVRLARGWEKHPIHGLPHPLLARRHQVRIHPQCQPRVGVPQVLAHGLNAFAGVQQQRGVEVIERVYAMLASGCMLAARPGLRNKGPRPARARAALSAGLPPCLRQRRPRPAARCVQAGEGRDVIRGHKKMPPAGDQPAPGWRGAADCGSVGACARSSHPIHRRPRQSRADAAYGVQVVRTVASST